MGVMYPSDHLSGYIPAVNTAFYPAISTFLYLTTMYVFCVYPAMSKKSENLSDIDKKDRNKRHSSPFINVVKAI
jgi:hypothetical protein